ncbi:unnamed protein product [Merluccius merluccius]
MESPAQDPASDPGTSSPEPAAPGMDQEEPPPPDGRRGDPAGAARRPRCVPHPPSKALDVYTLQTLLVTLPPVHAGGRDILDTEIGSSAVPRLGAGCGFQVLVGT